MKLSERLEAGASDLEVYELSFEARDAIAEIMREAVAALQKSEREDRQPFVGCRCPSCGEEFSASASPVVSSTTQALIALLIKRDQAGRAKYGTSLDRTDLSHAAWLQHMAEELLDGAGYALAAIRTEGERDDLYLKL